MAKHTLKILRCEHRKIFKVCLAIFQHYAIKGYKSSHEVYKSVLRKKSAIERSSRPEVFCKKGDLKNLAKFTGKHLCQSPFFNKVEGLRPATLFKKRPWHRCFSVNFAKFLKTSFLIEHFR